MIKAPVCKTDDCQFESDLWLHIAGWTNGMSQVSYARDPGSTPGHCNHTTTEYSTNILLWLWRNGNATDCGSVYLGSIPSSHPILTQRTFMDTNIHYSPWDQLPAPEPCTIDPPEDYFYDNTAKHLIKDTVRIMMNGLPINLERVSELEDTIDDMLTSVHDRLSSNPYVAQYIESRNQRIIDQYKEDRRSKLRQPSYYLKPFDYKKMDHRSYFMHIYSQQQNITQPSELLPTSVPKWPAKLVKKLSDSKPILRRLLNGELPSNHPIAKQAMHLLAQHKADIHNRTYLDEIDNPPLDNLPKAFELKPFNPGSSDQLRELFTMLGLESDKLTDKGQPSWNRDNVERVNRETTDPDMKELTQALIDYSFGSIIKQNFIPAFYKYTVDGRLHGQYVLFGAKSF